MNRVYAVSFDDGSGLRHCGVAGDRVLLVPGNARSYESGPTELSIANVDILSVIRGEVVWVGREL